MRPVVVGSSTLSASAILATGSLDPVTQGRYSRTLGRRLGQLSLARMICAMAMSGA
jgi:hypothetical protein